jgi:hypothetical protein
VPRDVKNVIFGYRYNQPTIIESAHTVEFGNDFDQTVIIPDGTEVVELYDHQKKYISYDADVHVTDVQQSADCAHRSEIKLGTYFNQPIVIPSGVHTLHFGFCYNKKIYFPPDMHSVVFGNKYNQYTIIKNAHTVIFGKTYNKPLHVPPSVHTVRIRND